MTSSISNESTCGVFRSTSPIQCAARSSGRVRLNDPRNDFASGVRELATTTASRTRRRLSRVLAEGRALFCEAFQQGGRLPQLSVLCFETLDTAVHLP